MKYLLCMKIIIFISYKFYYTIPNDYTVDIKYLDIKIYKYLDIKNQLSVRYGVEKIIFIFNTSNSKLPRVHYYMYKTKISAEKIILMEFSIVM